MYWLTQLPGATTGLWGEIIVPNFMGSDYKVVLIATNFSQDKQGDTCYIKDTDQSWDAGTGQWTVNYQQVSTTFWPLALYHKPVAVMTFSRNVQFTGWQFETLVRNDVQSVWRTGSTVVFAGTPFEGGAANDPAHQAGRPNSNGGTVSGSPPDRNFPSWAVAGNPSRGLSADSTNLIAAIKTAITSASIGVTPVDGFSAGTGGGESFVSSFVAYHAVWYQASYPSNCKIGFHTHVDYGLTLAQCQTALCLQLKAAIKYLGGSTTGTCTPTPTPTPTADLDNLPGEL